MLVLFFFIVVVADTCLLIDASKPARYAGFVQDCLG
jgi:hypothetical protein